MTKEIKKVKPTKEKPLKLKGNLDQLLKIALMPKKEGKKQ